MNFHIAIAGGGIQFRRDAADVRGFGGLRMTKRDDLLVHPSGTAAPHTSALARWFPRHSAMLSRDEIRFSLHDQKQEHQRAEVPIVDNQVTPLDSQLVQQRSFLRMTIFAADDV